MAQCGFCYTQVDDRATVCSGCGAKRGRALDQYGRSLNAKDLRRHAIMFALGGLAAQFILGTIGWGKTGWIVMIVCLVGAAVAWMRSRGNDKWFR